MPDFDFMKWCSVTLEVNAPHNIYETVEQHLRKMSFGEGRDERGYCADEWESEDDFLRAIESNTLVELHVYPQTPIGSYCIYGTDVGRVFKRMANILKDEPGYVPPGE